MPKTVPVPTSARPESYLGIGILVLVTAAIAILVSLSLKAHGIVFLGDDPSVIVSTIRQTFRQWFTQGFIYYFYVFPEWTTPYTNFSRPLVNIVLYNEYRLFSTNYLAYMSFYYVAGLFIAILVFRLCLLAGLRLPRALAPALMCLISPAFFSDGLTSPSYMFDVTAAAFVILALWLVVSERFGTAVIILILAVLTKENAIAAPIAAAFTVYLWKRRISLALMMLVPIIVWGLMRVAAFGSVFGGVYMTGGGLGDVMGRLPHALLTWPTGAFLLHLHNKAARLLGLIASAVGLVLLAYVAVAAVRLIIRPGRIPGIMQTPAARVPAASLIWLTVLLGYCLALGLVEARFGAALCPLLYLFVATDLWTGAPSALPSRYRTALSWAAFVSLFIISGLASVPTLRIILDKDPEQTRMKALDRALHALPKEGETVYLVNSPVIYSPSESIERFLDLKLHLVYVDQVTGCTEAASEHGTGVTVGQREDGLGKVLTIELPDCASFYFGGANDAVMAKVAATGARREHIGDYAFPDGHREATAVTPSMKPQFGQVLKFTPAEDRALVLSYRWDTGNFDSMSLAEAKAP